MAVVQISKIQVRRGQKNSGIGIPQLSSAEFAWAIDTQELFIGNGAVAEGAPYVGNTKVLTEHDNILELASSYQFASNDNSITLSEPRSLQSKLDEYVSILDFAPDDISDQIREGSTDCVAIFQTAFTQLFRNSDENYKKVLTVPNGNYLFASDLKIPSNAVIRGENNNKTVLIFNDNNILFTTSTGLEISEFDSSNRPTEITISNLTVSRTSGQTVLTGVADSKFENVKFQSTYVLNDSIGSLPSASSSVVWENSDAGTRVTGIEFEGCEFLSTGIAIRCDQLVVDSTNPPVFRTEINFNKCRFLNCDTAIYVSTDELLASQGNDWKINDCVFEEIANRAVYITGPGQGTIVHRSKFKNCGNGNSGANNPQIEVVYFGDQFGNIVKDCSFNRHQNAAIVSSNTIGAISEVINGAYVDIIDRNVATIYKSDSARPLAVFSAFNRFLTVNYTLSLGSNVRVGTLTITINDDLLNEEEYLVPSLTDQYQYSSASSTAPGGALMTNFIFSTELKDNDSDSGLETVVLYYKNPLASGAEGTISYSVSYGV